MLDSSRVPEMNWRHVSDRQLGEQSWRGVNAPEHPRTVAEHLSLLECDPIAGMARLSQDKSVPTGLRARLFAEPAHYMAPHAKSMELTGLEGRPLVFGTEFNTDALTNEELQMLHDLLLKAETSNSGKR
jgi:hypothetical protein